MHAPVPRRLASLTAVAAIAALAACATEDLPTAPVRPMAPSANITPSQFHVTSTADDGSDGTLRKEVTDAAAGDTVTIDASLAGQTITLVTGGLDILADLTILGPGPQGVTIKAAPTSRVFYVDFNTTLTLEDITITGGKQTSGGGIGAVGSLRLKRVTVTDNEATLSGGGIYVNGSLSMVDSRVTNNRAADQGAGIYAIAAVAPVSISRSTIAGNSVTTFGGDGGAIFSAANLTIDHSTISGNSATFGGGIYIFKSTTTLINSTVSGNQATNNGGGIFGYDGGGAAVLRHATVTANYSSEGGGLLWNSGFKVTFDNTIIAGNTTRPAGTNANCYIDGAPAYAGTSVSNDASCGIANANLIIADPKLGPLADNGGLTQTHKLLIGSSAIDAAPSCNFSDDQRGIARPQGPKCDAGATEFTDYVVPAFTIDPSGTTNQATGVAVVSGKHSCAAAVQLTLRVTVTQQQKIRKVPTAVTGWSDITVNCSTTQGWAASVKALTGAFNNSPANVTVQTVNTPAWVAPASTNAPAVIMAWSRR